MGLSCTISEINGDFNHKSQIFPNAVYLAPAEGVSLELGNGTWSPKNYTVSQKKCATFIFMITVTNVDQFSYFFHC